MPLVAVYFMSSVCTIHIANKVPYAAFQLLLIRCALPMMCRPWLSTFSTVIHPDAVRGFLPRHTFGCLLLVLLFAVRGHADADPLQYRRLRLYSVLVITSGSLCGQWFTDLRPRVIRGIRCVGVFVRLTVSWPGAKREPIC